MGNKENKQAARRIVEAFNTGDLAAVDQLVASEYVDHAFPPGVPPDREGFKAVVTALRAGFPDLQYTIEHEVAEGEWVAQRLLGKGTLTGEFMGMQPTGKSAVWQEMHLHRFNADSKIVEHWGVNDDLGMLMQLGIKPPM
jgi:predicted ester cyclase